VSDETIQQLQDRITALEQEHREWTRSAASGLCLNADSPLFDGLVGGSFSPWTLLATIKHVKEERDKARRCARKLFHLRLPMRYGDLTVWIKEYPWLDSDVDE
jgi:hypothetical protein